MLASILNLDDFQNAAQRHLPRPVYEYVAGAAEDGRAYRANRASFDDWSFVPRALIDVSERTQRRTLFGIDYATPFGIAPVGLSALAAYRGDLALAQAAAETETLMVLSGSSLIPLEEVIKVNPKAWFQAYLPGKRREIDALIARVRHAGFSTLVITVDFPVAGNRESSLRAGFSAPLRPNLRLLVDGLTHPRWAVGTFLRTLLLQGMPHFENNYAARGAPILSNRVLRDVSDRGDFDWQDLEHLRAIWPGNLVVKGLLHPDDGRRACALGADAVVVSNHGGRQLDGAVAPLRMLPAMIDACGSTPVLVDGGFRRGGDVLKAIALGARQVLLGRPFQFAASVAGERGVKHAICLLAREISRDMALLGLKDLGELNADYLLPNHPALKPTRTPSAPRGPHES